MTAVPENTAGLFRPLPPAACAALAFFSGAALCLPFGLATAAANAITEPAAILKVSPYLGLLFLWGALIFDAFRRPVKGWHGQWPRLVMAVWLGLAFPVWSRGESGTVLQAVGMISLLLLLVLPWWFAALAGPEHFSRRRWLFGILFWGGFVLVHRLFPSYNITTDTLLEHTALVQTQGALKLFGVLAAFWTLQVGFVILWKRVRAARAASR